MERIIRIATRGSRLALAQFDIISKGLSDKGFRAEPVIVKSHGEIDTATPLYKMGERGIFVKRLNELVLEGGADAAVHSAKDIPTQLQEGLRIVFFSQRGDVRDYFIGDPDFLSFRGKVGSGSIRRRMFLLLANRNLQFVDIRGNVDTRIGKWKRGEVDSLVVAKVALDRLGLSVPGAVIPEEICPPDPNQGFVAVVSRDGSPTSRIFSHLQTEPPLWEASVEREIMRELDTGCDVAISIRADYSSKRIKFSYANEDHRVDMSFRNDVSRADIEKMRDAIDG
ncbi:MAG: hydroxymethylbilane synthase [Thermoplasmata archaeon]